MSDFPRWAGGCLKIRTKTGDVRPLRLNQAQKYLHDKLEEQLTKIGRVRRMKGRQQGISTYISLIRHSAFAVHAAPAQTRVSVA